jgi:hypothetical protein
MTAWAGAIVAIAVIGATLVCCGSPDADEVEPPAASAPPSIISTASPVAPSASMQASAVVAPVTPKPMVEIPTGETPEPSPQEWMSAPRFNTRADGPTDPACHVDILREWFRYMCKDGGIPTLLAGAPGREYATRFAGDSYITGRLRRGDLYVAQDRASGTDVYARIAWPSVAAGPTVVEVWRDSAGGLAVYPEPPQPLPQIPATPSERPRPGDWVLSTPVNMGAAERRPKNCETRVLRDWLQWRCSGMRLESIEGFGVANQDHFKTNDIDRQYGEARLQAGASGTVRMRAGFDGPRVTIRVRWPADAPQPAEIFMVTETGTR